MGWSICRWKHICPKGIPVAFFLIVYDVVAADDHDNVDDITDGASESYIDDIDNNTAYFKKPWNKAFYIKRPNTKYSVLLMQFNPKSALI